MLSDDNSDPSKIPPSLPKIIEEKIPIGQNQITRNLIKFINSELTKRGRDAGTLEKLKTSLISHGYCDGITILKAYAWQMDQQPLTFDNKNNPILRYDSEWFYRNLYLLGKYDDIKDSLSKNENDEIEEFLMALEYFQNLSEYGQRAQQYIEEGLFDTKGRNLEKEYSITCFVADSNKILEVMNFDIFHDNKMILISSTDHVVTLFKQNKNYFLYNCNPSRGEIRIRSEDEVAKWIFDIGKINLKYPAMGITNPICAINIRIYDLSSPTHEKKEQSQYVSQKLILNKIEIRTTPILRRNNELAYLSCALAIKHNCLRSLEYYISLSPKINLISHDNPGNTLMMAAVRSGRLEIVNFLINESIKQNIDIINMASKSGETALSIAVERNFTDIAIRLLENKADPNVTLKNGSSILHFAILNENTEILKNLLDKNVNIDSMALEIIDKINNETIKQMFEPYKHHISLKKD